MTRTVARPIRAVFNAAALRRNHAVARQHAGPARVWSVVKANAYGHGLERTVAALAEVADGFALIELESAVALREAGVRQPILMLEGFYSAEELPTFGENHLTPVLHTLDQVGDFCAAALPARLPAYLKVNSGMNRLGMDKVDLGRALALLSASGVADEVTLMSHFADADGPRGVEWQMERMRAICAGLDLPMSLANSAALLRYPETARDWARPGIMLYGSSPFPDVSAGELGLQPVMTLESELIAVRDLAPGDHVGYGCLFTADRPMRAGIVACGYADGYPRHAPTGTPVLVGGRRTRTLGRPAMDKITVDITDCQTAEVGTRVVLWGDGLSADEVAMAAGTVSYELFCALAARVPIVELE
ncbi:MAG TPA: alanine racemase [Rhodocyclaceae bacterium]|nr:alanine racemase [Rhodocyclaceae bacterium]